VVTDERDNSTLLVPWDEITKAEQAEMDASVAWARPSQTAMNALRSIFQGSSFPEQAEIEAEYLLAFRLEQKESQPPGPSETTQTLRQMRALLRRNPGVAGLVDEVLSEMAGLPYRVVSLSDAIEETVRRSQQRRPRQDDLRHRIIRQCRNSIDFCGLPANDTPTGPLCRLLEVYISEMGLNYHPRRMARDALSLSSWK